MKKTFIFRKPKFMRNDELMQKFIDEAIRIAGIISITDFRTNEQYEIYADYRACIVAAAKAGGFFRTVDFIKWVESEKPELKIYV